MLNGLDNQRPKYTTTTYLTEVHRQYSRNPRKMIHGNNTVDGVECKVLISKMYSNRDLSNTAITSLPTKGLEKLEILRIEKTPSLKYIPSIYEFQVSILMNVM